MCYNPCPFFDSWTEDCRLPRGERCWQETYEEDYEEDYGDECDERTDS